MAENSEGKYYQIIMATIAIGTLSIGVYSFLSNHEHNLIQKEIDKLKLAEMQEAAKLRAMGKEMLSADGKRYIATPLKRVS
jgi:hypothetical protein